jgi:sigma-B regulation protein RsbU (phosphoserine phosphatase)
MIGDVTGHGIAPAMVTASILGGLGVLMRQGARDVMDVLCQLDESVVGACRGSYLSTVAGVIVDPAGTTQVFSCAGPPIVALSPDGDIKVVPLSSSPLGSGLKAFSIADLDAPPGSLIALCSDGLLEMRGERGRPFGVRRLGQVLARTESANLEATLMEIGSVLDDYRGQRALEDDVTLALIRVRK